MQQSNHYHHQLSWTKLPSPEDKRACHSSLILKNFIIAFGGWNGSKYFNDIIVYDLFDCKWKKIQPTGDVPVSRYTHSASLYQDDQIVVVGGYNPFGVLNETALLTLESEDDELSLDTISFKWETIVTTGGEELHRSDHTANIYEDTLYLFGGADEEEESTDELWALDLVDLKWTLCAVSGTKPEKRYGHCSVLFDKKIFILGGHCTQKRINFDDIWSLDLGTLGIRKLAWQRIQTGGASITAHTGATAQEIDGKIILFGGSRSGGFSKNLSIYDITTQQWKDVETKGEKMDEKRYMSSVMFGNQFIVWGGELGHRLCTSLIYSLEIEGVQYDHDIFTKKQKVPEFPAQQVLFKIFEEKTPPDVVLEVEGQEIAAHKSALSAGCNYFLNMFTIGMTESQAPKITIPDVKVETFRAIIRFIYGEELVLTHALVIDIMQWCDKYCFLQLKKVCERYLVKNLSIENFVQTAKVAEKYEVEKLRVVLHKFVKKNRRALRGRNDLIDLPHSYLIDFMLNSGYR